MTRTFLGHPIPAHAPKTDTRHVALILAGLKSLASTEAANRKAAR